MTTRHRLAGAARVCAAASSLALALAACGDDDPGQTQGGDDPGADAGSDLSFDADPDGALDVANEPDASTCGAEPYEVEVIGTVGLDGSGFSPTLTFDRPECAESTVIIMEGSDLATFIVASVVAPDGSEPVTAELTRQLDPLEQLFLGPFPGQFLSPNRTNSASGAAAALIPNNPDVVAPAGTYEFVVQGGILGNTLQPYTGTVEVTIIHKLQGTADGGVLDVNLFFTGAGGLTAESAPDSALMQAAVSRLDEIYSQVGIRTGEVRYFDVDAGFQTITSIEGPGNDMIRMFARGDGAPPGLNFFFVTRFEIQGAPGGAIGGISGGIPGPPLSPGAWRAGVAVSTEAAQGSSDALGFVMAHEGGHFLGLSHVVEFFGAEDPLADTPTGDAANTNLMFPTQGAGAELTAGQGFVLHNNPEVRR
jgi:hypothetical protein